MERLAMANMRQAHSTAGNEGLPGTFFRLSMVKSPVGVPTTYHLHFGTEREMEVAVTMGEEAEFEEAMKTKGSKFIPSSDQEEYYWYQGAIHEEKPLYFDDPRTCRVRVVHEGQTIHCSACILRDISEWFRARIDATNRSCTIGTPFPVSFQTLRLLLRLYHLTSGPLPVIESAAQLKELFRCGMLLGLTKWCSLLYDLISFHDERAPSYYHIDLEIASECREPLLVTYNRWFAKMDWLGVHVYYAQKPTHEFACIEQGFFLQWWRNMPNHWACTYEKPVVEELVRAWAKNHPSAVAEVLKTMRKESMENPERKRILSLDDFARLFGLRGPRKRERKQQQQDDSPPPPAKQSRYFLRGMK